MKKSLIATVMILLLLITVVPLGYAQEDTLLNISMEMISNVHTLAGDEYFFKTMMGPNCSMEYIPAIAESDCNDLRSAYSIRMPLHGLGLIFVYPDYSKLSEPGMIKVYHAFMGYGNYWNSINKGPQAVMESNMASWTYGYEKPEGFKECSWLIDCGGQLYCIAFYDDGENVITASATPVFLGEGESIETVIEYIEQESPFLTVTKEYPALED